MTLEFSRIYSKFHFAKGSLGNLLKSLDGSCHLTSLIQNADKS